MRNTTDPDLASIDRAVADRARAVLNDPNVTPAEHAHALYVLKSQRGPNYVGWASFVALLFAIAIASSDRHEVLMAIVAGVFVAGIGIGGALLLCASLALLHSFVVFAVCHLKRLVGQWTAG